MLTCTSAARKSHRATSVLAPGQPARTLSNNRGRARHWRERQRIWWVPERRSSLQTIRRLLLLKRTSQTTCPPRGFSIKIRVPLRVRLLQTNRSSRPIPNQGRYRTTRSQRMENLATGSTTTRPVSHFQMRSPPESRSKCGHPGPERTITRQRCTALPPTMGLALHSISRSLPTRFPFQSREIQATPLPLTPGQLSSRNHGAPTPPRRVLERWTYRRPPAL